MSSIKSIAKKIPGVHSLVKAFRRAVHPRKIGPQGPEGVKLLGHRAYVGGFWEEIGKLQFDFLIAQGLRPDHHLVDVGCGSLRAGIHFIRYLDVGHYCGVEKERELVRIGIAEELGQELFDAKRPSFIVTDRFEFELCERPPDFALAQSLFTHLTPDLIGLCLENLRPRIAGGGVFFATFNRSKTAKANPNESHDHDVFFYTRAQMEEFGRRAGWIPEYIGEWGHPRDQVMITYRPDPAL
jgi:SAM-dependent methyltransferase